MCQQDSREVCFAVYRNGIHKLLLTLNAGMIPFGRLSIVCTPKGRSLTKVERLVLAKIKTTAIEEKSL